MLQLLLLLACGSDAVECSAEISCGFGQTCDDGQCVATACATSDQCPMEHRCDDGTCVSGCAVDADCYPGDTCKADLASCRASGCRSTELDCSYREFCDTTTGECYDAGEQYCRPCDHDEECGEGNECWNHHCGVDCTTSPCPAGFVCLGFTDDFGNIVARQCLTYCWLYEDFPNESER